MSEYESANPGRLIKKSATSQQGFCFNTVSHYDGKKEHKTDVTKLTFNSFHCQQLSVLVLALSVIIQPPLEGHWYIALPLTCSAFMGVQEMNYHVFSPSAGDVTLL